VLVHAQFPSTFLPADYYVLYAFSFLHSWRLQLVSQFTSSSLTVASRCIYTHNSYCTINRTILWLYVYMCLILPTRSVYPNLNFHINQNFITLFLCFYFNSFIVCFPPLPILFSSTPNRSAAYAPGDAYHRLGTTATDGSNLLLGHSHVVYTLKYQS
jgi:hypothetical protein